MFDHPKIKKYDIDKIPLDADICLMDERWIPEYEAMLLHTLGNGEYENIGRVSFVAARSINQHHIDLTWYANIHDRWHEINISLPKSEIVTCVGCRDLDEKPRIFVKSAWNSHLHLQQYSIFCLIDAIDVKKAISAGSFTRSNLIALRNDLDALAATDPSISLVSFADTILVKSNWTVGKFDSNVKYTYNPDHFIHLANSINEIFYKCAGLRTYAVITQGANEFYNDSLLHISPSQNHISLNSLGAPFAKLIEIDSAVRSAIKTGIHPESDFYLDEQYYYSLTFKQGVDKNTRPAFSFKSKFPPSPGSYFCLLRNHVDTVLTT